MINDDRQPGENEVYTDYNLENMIFSLFQSSIITVYELYN